MPKPMCRVGSYVGTGSAVELGLGFVPDHLVIMNTTDRNAGLEWFSGMPAGTAIARTSTGFATQAANGITANPGTRGGTPAGVTIGTAGSVVGKTYHYKAMRGDD